MRKLWLIGILVILSGCRHKTLWMGGENFATIEVAFDWSGALTKADDETSPSMSLYLYPDDGKAPLYYELSGHEGGRIRVPFGRYTLVAWNHENDAILLRGQGHPATLEAYTRPQSILSSMSITTWAPRPESLEEERSVLEPGPFWTGHAENLEVSMEAPLQWSIPVEDAYIQFSVEVHDVENVAFVSQVSFALSSVSASYFPFTQTLGEDNVTIPFAGNVVDGTYLDGYCTLFGHCPHEYHPHWLTIYVILIDGRKYYVHADVTDLVHGGTPDPGIIAIDISGIALPDPFEGDPSAFADVDEWITEKIDLIMQ